MAASARARTMPSAGPAVRLPGLGPRPVIAAAALSALLVGALLAQRAELGFALLVAVLYGPIAFINFPLGIALWFPSVFVSYLPGLGDPAHAAAVLLGVAWLGTLAASRPGRSAVREHRPLVAAAVGLVLWLLLSLAWASEPSHGLLGMLMWVPPVILFGMVITAVRTERHARWLAYAFVAGAVSSVLIGLVLNGMQPASSAIDTATRQAGRLQGGAGDPNVLAAGLVPAIALAAGLIIAVRAAAIRIGLVVVIAVLGVGLAATESRGGLIAMAVALVAAVAVAKGRRGAIVVLALLSIGGGAAWFVNTPTGWERITSFDGGGNGRSDLWNVGWDMARDHPVVGVGLSNYPDRAVDYVRRPRELQFVELIAEKPHVVHNTYLQLMAETGVVGLLLFLAVAAGAMAASLRAARQFDARGDDGMATLSRAVFVATLALLTASFFLTNGHDSRLWLLFALGPALVAISRPRQAA
jgi:O-antigen ligase